MHALTFSYYIHIFFLKPMTTATTKLISWRKEIIRPTGLFLYYYHHPSSTSLLYPKSLLTMETRERRERWCDGAYALSPFHRWMSRTVSMIVYQHHTLEKEWVMMHNCRCAWIELKNFHMFYFSLYKCRYIYIYIRKTYTSIQFKRKKESIKQHTKKIINKHCSNKFSFDNNQILVHR